MARHRHPGLRLRLGAFAERLAGHGFASITNYDPFASPVRPAGKFSLITCFEVIEHTVSPRACLQDMVSFLAPGGCIIFSQPLQPDDIEMIRGNWWYIGPRNGHASIFTADALSRLARHCGLVFHRGDWLHGFAPADATEASRGILAAIGAPMPHYDWMHPWTRLACRCGAEQAAAWHRLERDGGSASAGRGEPHRVARPAAGPYPLRLRIAVPFVNQIRDGFAEACTIEVGGQALPHVHGTELIAETTLAEPVENVVILQPRSPSRHGTPRRRTTGARPGDRGLSVGAPGRR